MAEGEQAKNAFLTAWREQGYTVLAHEIPKEVPPEPSGRRAAGAELLKHRPGKSPADAPKIEHRPPLVPMRVDGREERGEALKEFAGRPLYFMVEPEGDYGARLHAFSDEEEAMEAIAAAREGEEEHAHDRHGFFGSHVQPTYPAYFFEHINCAGARLSLDYRHAFWDLREHWLGGILWWWTSWNDQISSLITTGRSVRLYEHPAWGGSWIYFGPNKVVPNLLAFGWNDRTSSIETTY